MDNTEPFNARSTLYDDNDVACDRTVASLLIYPGDMEPDSISEFLGISPTECATKGEIKRNYNGKPRIVSLNFWMLSSEKNVKSLDLRRHLDWLLELLAPAREQLIHIQRSPGLRMRINCVWWSAFGGGGPTLWPEQMLKIANLNLECSFDFAYYNINIEESEETM